MRRPDAKDILWRQNSLFNWDGSSDRLDSLLDGISWRMTNTSFRLVSGTVYKMYDVGTVRAINEMFAVATCLSSKLVQRVFVGLILLILLAVMRIYEA